VKKKKGAHQVTRGKDRQANQKAGEVASSIPRIKLRKWGGREGIRPK